MVIHAGLAAGRALRDEHGHGSRREREDIGNAYPRAATGTMSAVAARGLTLCSAFRGRINSSSMTGMTAYTAASATTG